MTNEVASILLGFLALVLTVTLPVVGWMFKSTLDLLRWKSALDERLQPDRELRSELPAAISQLTNNATDLRMLREDMATLRGEIHATLREITGRIEQCFSQCPVRGDMTVLVEAVYEKIRSRYHCPRKESELPCSRDVLS